MRGQTKMMKTIYALAFAFLMIFSPAAYASSSSYSRFDVSIDRVVLNGQPIVSGRNNLVQEAANFAVTVDFTSLENTNNVHAEVSLRDTRSGNTIADTSVAENIASGQRYTKTFTINLADPFDDSSSFELLVRVIDSDGRSEQKTYGLRTEDSVSSSSSGFRASIDRVLVNTKALSSSSQNLIEENNVLNFQAEITAVEDLEDAHVEIMLRDRNSGYSLSDSSSNFDLDKDSSRTLTFRADLIDPIAKSGNFDLTVKVIDSQGRMTSKSYGIVTDDAKSPLASAGFGTLDVSVDSVEVEDEPIAQSQTNYIKISQRTKEIDVDVSLTAREDVDKARVNAVLAYENGDVVSDITSNFDFSDESTVTKKLELPLLAQFEQGIFRLTVKITDEDGDFLEKFYTLKLTTSAFPVLIESIELSPQSRIFAGKLVVAKVQMQNSGLVSLNAMTATLSIPELGVSETRFLGKSAVGNEITEEFTLKIPSGAASGTYTVAAEVSQQFSGQKESKSISISVVGTDEQPAVLDDKLVVSVPITKQTIEKNQRASYPITFRNEGPAAKAYTLSVENDWADVGFSDSSSFVLKSKEAKTINVYVSSNEKFSGTKSTLIFVSDSSGQISSIRLDSEMNAGAKLQIFGAKLALMVLLIFLVAALVVYAAYEGLNKSKGAEEELSEEKSEAGSIQAEPYY